MNKEHALNLLWISFQKHLEEDWPIYTTFGQNLEEAQQQIKFCDEVVVQMNAFFKANHIAFDPPNPLTLYNYFKTNGFSINAKTKTLNSFSAFIGYKNWKDFCENIEADQENFDIQKQPSTKSVNNSIGEKISLDPKSSNTRAWKKYKFLIITLLLLLACYGLWQFFSQPDHENLIAKTLKNANKAEFGAYAKVPEIDSNNLKKYFNVDGTAYNSVLGLLLRSKEKGRKLLIPPSSHVVEEYELESVKDNTAIAYTTEHWIIRWYDSTTQKQILYDTINHHKYYLKNIDGKWKVHIDEYVGRARIPASEHVK